VQNWDKLSYHSLQEEVVAGRIEHESALGYGGNYSVFWKQKRRISLRGGRPIL